jgi:hypothetical protein
VNAEQVGHLREEPLASSHQIRDVSFASQSQRRCDRTKSVQSFIPAEPGDQRTQRVATGFANFFEACL